MADDEKPGTPEAPAGATDAPLDEPDAGEERTAGGRLIQAEVFLSRLAERQEERGLAAGEASVVDAILGALESLGFDPNLVAPVFVRMARKSPVEEEPAAIDDTEPPGLEDMAVEERFLTELRAGPRPNLDAYAHGMAAHSRALIQLVTRMDPAELMGLDAPEALTPEQDAAVRDGQEAGTLRALREVAKRGGQRGRGDAQSVAEEQAPYDASHTGGSPGDTPKERPARGRKRARPVRPEESRPEG
jgi:hypothetical protein